MKSLVIVESPAKVKTIGKFLGRGYTIKASMGHVRDLPKSTMGVDISKGYEPKYINIRGKGKIIQELKESAKKVDRVLLATDPDREGEAISWHLAGILDIEEREPCRIEFNEITRNAVEQAISNPRPLDMDRVYAQQARRILDRLVGYKLSPLLWQKVRRGLSAGRVQSVAVRLICDREREIESFVAEEYWSITAHLTSKKDYEPFGAKLVLKSGKKIPLPNEAITKGVLADLKGKSYIVASVKTKERKRAPAPPFTTSTMQQESSRRLGFSTRRTMIVAQQLYEGLDVGDEGSIGLVTYIRTDSMRVAGEAQTQARAYIAARFGEDYVPGSPPHYKSKKTSQDAHEAIRPTSVAREPSHVKPYLTRDQYRLYNLIWERFVASQMSPAVLDVATVDIAAGDYLFRSTGTVVKFPGFMALYTEAQDEKEEKPEEEKALPALVEGEELRLLKLVPDQHFTQPPPRYTEAGLVKALEENGIGRPSTYAPIVDTILRRNYVYIEEKRFRPTELGFIVVDLLKECFSDIIDVEFTANMEDRLDKIAEGEINWTRVLQEFYEPFEKTLEAATATVERIRVPDEVTDEVCPECGRNLVIKTGRFGRFMACPGFPECKYTKKIVKEVGVTCPDCGGAVVERRTKRGRRFYGCSNYPNCKFTTWNQPVARTCPVCGAFLVQERRNGGLQYKCVREACDYGETGRSGAS